ncbi:MAG: tetratricopeptide repeat protein [Bacteroidota bacterium]
MKLILALTSFLITAVWITSYGQNVSLNQGFQEAVRLEAEGEKRQAFNIWSSLAAENPANGNLQYRAGISHLESFNEKRGALPFLRVAEDIGVDLKYDPISVQETKSPITLYYYLGKAYHLNNNLDKAIIYYEKFQEVAPAKHFLFDDAILGAQQADNAKDIMANPVKFEVVNLGDTINSPFPDYSPVISIDENSIFYTSRRIRTDSSNEFILDRNTGGFFEDIYVSYKNRKGQWQEPELLNINSDVHSATMNVSPNGQTLYIYRDDEGGSIYESTLVGESWTDPRKLEAPINSPSWETHLAASVDGNQVYFISNRKGGIGGRDIWSCKKLPDGKWGEPENLGPTLNTQYEEDAVFISPDENTLYFSSQGHNSIGGFDVFTSTKDDEGNWSEPKNIGFPINTTDDDVFFVTSGDGKRAYFSSVREEGFGEKDLYILELPDPPEVRLAVLKGEIIPAPGEELPGDISVAVTNNQTLETTYYTPRQRDGNFIAILAPCYDYSVEYIIDGNTAGVDSFEVDCESAYREIEKTLLLQPVLLGEGGNKVLVSATNDVEEPASFKKFFGYNANEVPQEEDLFRSFIATLKTKATNQEKVQIEIVGSASKVPTKTYGRNQYLADLRADNIKERILRAANDFKIDPNLLDFIAVEGRVQGPDYKGDYLTNKEVYQKFQYVEVIAK